MKDSVQTHFQNMETDEGYFVDYTHTPVLSCDQTIEGGSAF